MRAVMEVGLAADSEISQSMCLSKMFMALGDGMKGDRT